MIRRTCLLMLVVTVLAYCPRLAPAVGELGANTRKLLTYYPYGMAHDSSADQKLSASAAFVYSATGSRILIVRADWFVATAAVTPLYHELLRLPSGPGADRELERQLKVDVERDFQKNRLQRAGFNKSNVSEHNRLVDRHPSAYGAYWKSYDFASTSGRQDLTQFPLGPDFKDNEFSRFAFQQDGARSSSICPMDCMRTC